MAAQFWYESLVRRPIDPDTENWLRHTLRAFLHRWAPEQEAPSLVRADVCSDVCGDFSDRDLRLRLFLSNGHDYCLEIPQEHYRRGDRYGDSIAAAAERVYSHLVEDRHVNRSLARLRRTIDRARLQMLPPDVIGSMQRELEDAERHVRQHHRDDRSDAVTYSFSTTSVISESDNLLPEPTPAALMEARDHLQRMVERDFNAFLLEPIPPAPTRDLTVEDVRRQMREVGGGAGGRGIYETAFDRLIVDGSVAYLIGGGGGRDIGTKEAQKKGMALLKANLTPAQLQQYEALNHFEVTGCDTSTRYRIRHGRQMNIEALDRNGNRKYGICFLPQGNLVAGDCMLAQKIALETMESQALKVANRFP